ncbi:MAG: hypothetical protein EHM66_00450 [Deltaproteobacteria bacterium]|nr:MAG: hypothetical protein EHM66_00450 [Deltaproteobacteria bacterium]
MKSTPIRIDDAVIKEVTAIAKEHDRTATGQFRIIFREWKAAQRPTRQQPAGQQPDESLV